MMKSMDCAKISQACRLNLSARAGSSSTLAMKKFLIILLQAVNLAAFGASNHYIRAGATGANNGSDWANAYTSIPSTLTRGDTYYFADGNYGSFKFSTAQSGTNYVYFKKAFDAYDHGTDAGWVSSYGQTNATFGPITLNSGYLSFDGQTNYGFQVFYTTIGSMGIGLYVAPWTVIRQTECIGPAGTNDFNFTTSTVGIGTASGLATNLTVDHCSIHGSDTLIFLTGGAGGSDNFTLEYSDLHDSRSINANAHSNCIYVGSGNNDTFRFNRFHNYNVEGIFYSYGGQTGNAIYGNVFYDGVSVAVGVEFRQSYNYGSTLIYNNTFVNLPEGAVLDLTPTTSNTTVGCAGFNNLAYNCSFSWGTITNLGANITVKTSPFVNLASDDYHLATHTTAGVVLPAPYDVDPDGVYRNYDNNWDVGAYEFANSVVQEPVIQTVHDTYLTTNAIALTWMTDENANSIVKYGSSTAYGFSIVNSAMQTSHSIDITNMMLQTGTTYIQVQSTDSQNRTNTASYVIPPAASGLTP